MNDSMTGPEAEPFGTEADVPVEPAAEPGPEPALSVEREFDPAAPAPLDVPRTPTGHADVDAQLDRLADADHLATDGHMEVYEDVHQGLRDALTALDARPGPPGPPSPHSNSDRNTNSYSNRS